ncbi:MAG: hypothetical protein GXC76_14900 [Rhodanobacteraceae bacterium]|jgi:hypothetical protein|nr:hypothetical protein [Rhodanobacteraceae bacterium]
MAENEFLLRREFVDQVIQARLFSAQIAELAVALAVQAGESVTRPLSAQQIARAVQVNGVETRLAVDALIARLQALYREGQLPEDAGVPRW